MARNVLIKVMGFRDVERHAIATLLRLSQERSVSYSLWTPEQPVPPDLILVDLEAQEAVQDLARSSEDRSLPLVCIGPSAQTGAIAHFRRPLQWPEVVDALDRWVLASLQSALAVGIAAGRAPESAQVTLPERTVLLVAPHRPDRLYLRARLALSGHTEVDEAATGARGLELARLRHYDLVLLDLEVGDVEGWSLVRRVVALEPTIGAVVALSRDTDWHATEYATQSGCRGLLRKPFDPQELVLFLERLWRGNP